MRQLFFNGCFRGGQKWPQPANKKLKTDIYIYIFILGSCLQVDPSPHNFNSDLLPPPMRDLKVFCPWGFICVF